MTLIGDDLQGDCPNCHRASGFKVLEQRGRVWPERWSPSFSGGGPPARSVFEYASLAILECLFCRDTVVFIDRFHKPDPDSWESNLVSRTMVAPRDKPREMNSAAPEAVRSLFAEASVCEAAGSLRAAAVMYRAAVEELVKDRGATGSTLFSKIDSLRSSGVSNEVIEDFHEARMLGNDSIHAGLTYSAEEVADVAGLIEEAVLVIYVQPEEKRRMRDQRRQRRGGSTT